MPVIAIELDDKRQGRNKCIYAELVADDVLFFVWDSDSIKDGISGALKFVWMHGELLGVHFHQCLSAFWVFISARKRTVCDIVRLTARWRPLERFPANLAGMFRFVASLPFVGVFFGAKKVFPVQLMLLDVNRLSTHRARPNFAGFSLWPSGFSVTLKRAVFLSLPHMVGDDFPAYDASYRANFVTHFSFHDLIVT